MLLESQQQRILVTSEMKDDVFKWSSAQARASNEGERGQQEYANGLRDSICQKYKITIAELVAIAENKPVGGMNYEQ